MLCAGDERQVGGFTVPGLLRQPGKCYSFQIVAIYAEEIGRLNAIASLQCGEPFAQGLVMCAASAQINFFCALPRLGF